LGAHFAGTSQPFCWHQQNANPIELISFCFIDHFTGIGKMIGDINATLLNRGSFLVCSF
jgi:hypothetical protein